MAQATVNQAGERSGKVTFKGAPMTLVGPELKVGDTAPEFQGVSADMKSVKLSDFKGKTVILSVVPSLDTPVCAEQTKKFNDTAKEIDAKVLTVSLDLPFAQKRYCTVNHIEDLLTVSDAKDREFAHNYGLYIKELGLLARSVFVINKEGKITYIELVPEIASQPDYEKALEAARAAG